MFNTPAFIYLATVLPPILIGIMIWKSDKFPEPGKFLVTAFLLGVAITLYAIIRNLNVIKIIPMLLSITF